MATEKMKRLKLIAAKSERDELFRELMKLGCIQISEQEPEGDDSEKTGAFFREKAGLEEYRAEHEKLLQGIELLKKYSPTKLGIFHRKPKVSKQTLLDEKTVPEIIDISQTIRLTDEQIETIKTEENVLSGLLDSLKPWTSLDIPIGLKETETCELMTGKLPAAIKLVYLEKELSSEVPESQLLKISSDKTSHYIILVAMKENRQSAIEAAEKYGYEPVSFGSLEKTAGESGTELKSKLGVLSAEKKELTALVSSMSASEDELKLNADRLLNNVVLAESMERLLCTEYTINFEAYFPENDEKRILKVLSSFDCAWEITEPSKEETAIVPCRLRHGLFYRMKKRRLLQAGRKQFKPLAVETSFVNILKES